LGLFSISSPKEKGTQLYFRDDGSFQFRKLLIEDEALVEKNDASVVLKAWKMLYKLLKQFDGYKGIAADNVTISFGRDIIFDPFNQLNETEKPSKGKALKKDFIKNIAEAKCYMHEKTAKPSLIMDRFTLFLGGTMIIMAIGLMAKIALTRGG
jgi:hypothetical protein